MIGAGHWLMTGGDRSMIASRLWPIPTLSSIQCPSPSGPRCEIASVMRWRSLGETGWPSVLISRRCRTRQLPLHDHDARGRPAGVIERESPLSAFRRLEKRSDLKIEKSVGNVLVIVRGHAVVERNRHCIGVAIAGGG